MRINLHISKKHDDKKGSYVFVSYLQEMVSLDGRDTWLIKDRDLSFEVDLARAKVITFYGKSDASVSLSFIYAANRNGVSLNFFTRNMKESITLGRTGRAVNKDIVSLQVLARQDERRRNYIARVILGAKIKTQNWLIPYEPALITKKNNIEQLRVIEANYARRYWKKYFLQFKESDRPTSRQKDNHNEINKALNAGYFMLSTSINRWLHHHGFSIFHAYIHTSVNYETLSYDLLEPYRWIVDKSVIRVYQKHGICKDFIKKVTDEVTFSLHNHVVWVHSTQ